MIVKDLDTMGYHRVVFRCDNEPSILSPLRAVKLAWTGDVSAEGDPQSNGAAESSVNVVKGQQEDEEPQCKRHRPEGEGRRLAPPGKGVAVAVAAARRDRHRPPLAKRGLEQETEMTDATIRTAG